MKDYQYDEILSSGDTFGRTYTIFRVSGKDAPNHMQTHLYHVSFVDWNSRTGTSEYNLSITDAKKLGESFCSSNVHPHLFNKV